MTPIPIATMLVAGLLLVWGLGVLPLRSPRVLLALGPAWLLGVAATSVHSIAFLSCGIGLLTAFFLAAAALMCVGTVLAVRRRQAGVAVAPAAARLNPALLGALAGLALLTVVGTLIASNLPLEFWDAWSIYGRKAISLYTSGGLDASFFTNPNNVYAHADYPLLLPLREATAMHFGLSRNGTGAPVLAWLLLMAWAWTAVYVAIDVAGNALGAIGAFALVLLPGAYGQAFNGYADLPTAVFIGAGALFAACWLRTGATKHLVVGATCLAGAAATKNEGLFGAAVVLAAALAVAGGSTPARRRDALVAAFCVLLATLPWRLWVASHGIHGDVPLVQGLSPGYLAGRLGRTSQATRSLARHSVGQDWSFFLPVAVGIAAVSLALPETRRIAAFHLAAGFGYLGVLVWIYTISNNAVGWYLATSAPRTVTPLAFIAASAIVHLSAQVAPGISVPVSRGEETHGPPVA